MDKDRIKGKAKDIAGRVQRQAGEWTGDPETQAKGAAKQAEGKVRNAWGKTRDKAREIHDQAEESRREREENMGRGPGTLDEEIAADERATRKRETEAPMRPRDKRAA